MQQMYIRTPMLKCDFNKATQQFSRNHTLVWVFSCEFAAFFLIFDKKIPGGLLSYRWLLFCGAKWTNVVAGNESMSLI